MPCPCLRHRRFPQVESTEKSRDYKVRYSLGNGLVGFDTWSIGLSVFFCFFVLGLLYRGSFVALNRP